MPGNEEKWTVAPVMLTNVPGLSGGTKYGDLAPKFPTYMGFSLQ